MDQAWRTAVEFLLIDDRAQALAESHPLTIDGRCERCGQSECAAAWLASEALAVLRSRDPDVWRSVPKRPLRGLRGPTTRTETIVAQPG
jgi:hypothetical protein